MSRWVWLACRSQRPAVGGVPGQLSRQNALLACGVCHSRRSLVLARRAAVALVSTLVCGFPCSLGEGETHQTIEGDTP